MKSLIAKILLSLVIMAFCAGFLLSFKVSGKVATDKEGSSFFSFLVKALNVQDLAVGFLWMQFDNDTVYMLANHHRLLINLDSITAIKHDEFAAWSLKNFMRIEQALRKNDEQMKARALRDYRLACELNPDNWEFFHDAAQIIYKRLKDLDLAQEYAEKACKFAEHKVKAKRLLALIYFDQKKYNLSRQAYCDVVESQDASPSELNVARIMIAEIDRILDQK